MIKMNKIPSYIGDRPNYQRDNHVAEMQPYKYYNVPTKQRAVKV